MKALQLAYGVGLRTIEVVSPRISEIDSDRQLIQVELSKGRKNCYAMMPLDLQDLLRAW